MIEPFLSAVPVLKRLEDAGYEAYFVGGSVRDYLLGKMISDVDIATSATPAEMKAVFPKTIDIGIEHGTILVLFENETYEITTFRSEAEYVDYRRPKGVSFIRSLKEDLQRRDFTMNAIAMDRNGTIIDPFNGETAIKEQIIKTVGSAEERFGEDALRMMRAVRFVSQLSFSIEKETEIALKQFVHLLENIAIERKRAEFEKLLIGKNRKSALKLMLETNLYSFLPGLLNKRGQLEHILTFDLENLSINEMWSLLLFCLGLKDKGADAFLRNWRLPIKDIKDILHILAFVKKRLEEEWSVYDLYMAGRDIIQSSEKLFLVIEGKKEKGSVTYWLNEYDKLPIKGRSEIDVTGNDLMAWFNQNGGPWLKEALLKIEKAILEGNVVNVKQNIKEWLMKCSQK